MKIFKYFLISVLCAQTLFAAKTQEIYASFDVLARKSAKLSLNAMGVVSKIYKDVGDVVKKGDVLLELDSKLEQIGLKDANIQIELAKLAQQHSISTYNRYEQVKSVINEQSFDEIEFKKNEIDEKIKLAFLNKEKYQTLIENKTLKAPFDGVITAKLSEVGAGVAGMQQPVFVLESYPQVKLLLSFDEQYAELIKVGDTFEYEISGKKQSGKIHKIYPSIDVKSRKIYAEVLANDILIGSFGEGKIIVERKR